MIIYPLPNISTNIIIYWKILENHTNELSIMTSEHVFFSNVLLGIHYMILHYSGSVFNINLEQQIFLWIFKAWNKPNNKKYNIVMRIIIWMDLSDITSYAKC